MSSIGTDMVAKAAHYVFGKIKELIGSVVEFVKGIWDKVGMAHDSVKSFIAFNQRKWLVRGSIIFKGTVAFGQAATMLDTTCEDPDHLLQEVEGPKPQFTIISSSVHKSLGTCTADVIFQTTELADELGRHFTRLFDESGTTALVSWTARSQSSSLPSDPENQNAIEATLNYLWDTISTAVEARYVVHGAIEKTSIFRVAEIACRDVPARDASRVSAIMEKVFFDELERKIPLPESPNAAQFSFVHGNA